MNCHCDPDGFIWSGNLKKKVQTNRLPRRYAPRNDMPNKLINYFFRIYTDIGTP